MSRMSQVIEDSIRGHLEAAAAKAAAVEQQPQRKRNSDPMYGGAEPESDEMFSRYGNSSSSRYGGPTGHPPQPPRSRGGPVGGYPGGHPMPGPHEMMEKWSGPPLPPENAHGESREARASYIPGRCAYQTRPKKACLNRSLLIRWNVIFQYFCQRLDFS